MVAPCGIGGGPDDNDDDNNVSPQAGIVTGCAAMFPSELVSIFPDLADISDATEGICPLWQSNRI
jgi:hypothetical protein